MKLSFNSFGTCWRFWYAFIHNTDERFFKFLNRIRLAFKFSTWNIFIRDFQIGSRLLWSGLVLTHKLYHILAPNEIWNTVFNPCLFCHFMLHIQYVLTIWGKVYHMMFCCYFISAKVCSNMLDLYPNMCVFRKVMCMLDLEHIPLNTTTPCFDKGGGICIYCFCV